MMTLGGLLRAPAVLELVRQARAQGCGPNQTPAMPEAQVLGIIHAALWLHGVRDDSTSAAYAWSSLEAALSGASWGEAREMRRALGLRLWGEHPRGREVWAMRLALGLNPDPWARFEEGAPA